MLFGGHLWVVTATKNMLLSREHISAVSHFQQLNIERFFQGAVTEELKELPSLNQTEYLHVMYKLSHTFR